MTGSPRHARRIHPARLAGGILVVAFIAWWFWLYPMETSVRWKEEVRTPDGKLTVELTNTYRRRARTLNLFDGKNLYLARKVIAFESAPGQRVLLSTHEDVTYLGRFGNDWFVVFHGDSQRAWPDEARNRWGNDFTRTSHRLAKLKGTQFEPVAWEEAPAAIRRENMVRGSFYQPEFGRWDGRTVSLPEKDAFYNRHRVPGMYEIARPIRLSP